MEEPLLFSTSYEIQWFGSKVDLVELAKLRWIEGWSYQRLANHFNRTPCAINNYCQKTRKKSLKPSQQLAEFRNQRYHQFMNRRELKIRPITVNGRRISKVVVDPHIDKHKDITDDVILDLVRELDGAEQPPDDTKAPFEYFVSRIKIYERSYRLVWLLEDNQLYIGIVTAFREKKRSKS